MPLEALLSSASVRLRCCFAVCRFKRGLRFQISSPGRFSPSPHKDIFASAWTDTRRSSVALAFCRFSKFRRRCCLMIDRALAVPPGLGGTKAGGLPPMRFLLASLPLFRFYDILMFSRCCRLASSYRRHCRYERLISLAGRPQFSRR